MNVSAAPPVIVDEGDRGAEPASGSFPTISIKSDVLVWFVATAAFVVICLSARFCLKAGLSWRCPVQAVLHLPCPGCGSSRALGALSEGRVAEALAFNPLVVLIVPFGALAFMFRRSLAVHGRVGWPLFAAAVLLNWMYLYFFLTR